jgi:hypothetical protein
MNRRLRVVFSKKESGEPELAGEAIPPEVLKGFEKQLLVANDRKGAVTFARGDILYSLDFEEL